jgi:hypothetical protein
MFDFIERHAVSSDPKDFFEAAQQLRRLLDQNPTEQELQSLLEKHPRILSAQFPHCHHVFPRVAFGERFEADFLCLDIPSSGKEWIAIEIEVPSKKLITKSGRRTAVLEHAIQQVRDWRRWLTDNIDYARRPRDRNGLGLEDIQPRSIAWVIIGQRQFFTDEFNSLRQQIFRDELIQIRSWDGVAEWALKRAAVFYGGGSPGLKIVVQ